MSPKSPLKKFIERSDANLVRRYCGVTPVAICQSRPRSTSKAACRSLGRTNMSMSCATRPRCAEAFKAMRLAPLISITVQPASVIARNAGSASRMAMRDLVHSIFCRPTRRG